jgi:flagellar motor switch protein FliG
MVLRKDITCLEEVLLLRDDQVQQVMKDLEGVDPYTMVLALFKGTSEEFREKVLRAVTDKARLLMQGEMEKLEADPADIEKAKGAVLERIRCPGTLTDLDENEERN